MTNDKLELKVFLTNLSKYAEGELCGKWVEVLTSTNWEKELQEIGIDGVKYEEYFITDFDCNFGLELGEYSFIAELQALAEKIEELNKDCVDSDILSGLLELTGNDFDNAYNHVIDGDYFYIPDVSDESDIGYYLVDEGLFGEVPEKVAMYLDYKAIGRDYIINSAGTFTNNGYVSIAN